VSVDLEVSFGTGAVEPMQEDFMNSKMISRAACLEELTSNPKSFFNCPDLHGGPGLPEGSYQEDVERLISEPDCIIEKWRRKFASERMG
jgi:hypothetical protein